MRMKYLTLLIPILALVSLAVTSNAPAPFTLHDLGNGASGRIRQQCGVF